MTPHEVFELGVGYAHTLKKLDIAIKYLLEISNQDFIGKRPESAIKASEALKAIKDVELFGNLSK